MLYQSSEIKIKAARDATYPLDCSTLNETFFPAVCDSFALCLLFLLFAALFIFCRLSVGGRSLTRERLRGTGRSTACNFISLLFNFLSPLNFRFLIFLFLCLCVFHPPTRCYRSYIQCRSKTSVLYFRYVRLFSLFSFHFLCTFETKFYAKNCHSQNVLRIASEKYFNFFTTTCYVLQFNYFTLIIILFKSATLIFLSKII